MEFCSEISAFSVPVSSRDKTEDIRNLEVTANKALKQIQSLYEEIMAPNNSSMHDSVSDENNSFSSNDTKCKHNHCLKSCSILGNTCCCCERVTSQSVLYKCNEIPFQKHYEQSSSFKLKDYNIERCLNDRNLSKCLLRPELKVTVPQPFSLSFEDTERVVAKERKISKLKEQLNYEAEKELKVKIHTKPVPKSTHLPLYGEMVKRNEKRKIERKVKCIEVTKNLIKPFNFSASSKAKSLCDLTITEPREYFKAKPLPQNIISSKISENLKNKEEIRKILIAHRAEESLKNSKLPFSPKIIPRSHSAHNLNHSPSENNRKEDKVKNIAAITKRLYTKKCKETMENWNAKVKNLHCPQEEKSIAEILSEKKRVKPIQTLPFSYFPVRMSTAAVLRKSRIREEIIARERMHEEEVHSEEEATKKLKQIQKNIQARLKNFDMTSDFRKEIEAKVQSFRVSQIDREHEYEKELQEMMKRVSKQLLLVERQSKKTVIITAIYKN
ncbi:protein FAM161A-like isoform X2 [Stegodyphus dumicola]|uniref:protein FAM161A-like isoform X2 n=1 Tax=Stegodyphus dumicola TaxID=202533 RepID=UPI0015ABA125|nr:protein FAM161A-like isoform X2 [Stegodyphus dumicola]